MTCCLIVEVGCQGQAIQRKYSSDQYLTVVAMTTNFGTKIAITGFVRTIATRQLAMEGGLSGRLTECRYCRYFAHRGRCHGNHFLAFCIVPPSEYD